MKSQRTNTLLMIPWAWLTAFSKIPLPAAMTPLNYHSVKKNSFIRHHAKFDIHYFFVLRCKSAPWIDSVIIVKYRTKNCMYNMIHYFFVNRLNLWNIILFARLANRFVQGHLVAVCNKSFIHIFRNCETFILAVFTTFSNCVAGFLKSKTATVYQKSKQNNIVFFQIQKCILC